MERSMSLFPELINGEIIQATDASVEPQGVNCISELESKDLTESQIKIVSAYRKCGSVRIAAKECGISFDHAERTLQRARDRLGKKNIKDMLTDDVKLNRANNSDHRITSKDLMQLIDRQQYRCALSGVELTTENANLDHKVPVSKGGSHLIDNVQWVHESVNAAKGSMSVDEFIKMCHRVVQWTGG